MQTPRCYRTKGELPTFIKIQHNYLKNMAFIFQVGLEALSQSQV